MAVIPLFVLGIQVFVLLLVVECTCYFVVGARILAAVDLGKRLAENE